MARFCGSVTGKTDVEIHRRGHKNILTKAQTWNFGINVYAYVNEEGKEVFTVYMTGGSNDQHTSKRIGVFTKESLEKDIIVSEIKIEHKDG